MNVRASIVGSMAAVLLALLGGCGGIPLPLVSPDPYSDSLLEYLSLPHVVRADVHRWLGAPDATRMSGRLEVYVEAREMSREIVRNIAATDIHVLMIEYEEDGAVRWAEEVKLERGAARCAARGVCAALEGAYREVNPLYGWSAADAASAAIEGLSIYRERDPGADFNPVGGGPAGCLMAARCADPESFPCQDLRVRHEHDDQAYLLPAGSLVTWAVSPGPQVLLLDAVAYRAGRTTPRRIEWTCEEGAVLVAAIRLRKEPGSPLFSPRFLIDVKQFDAEVGNAVDATREIIR